MGLSFTFGSFLLSLLHSHRALPSCHRWRMNKFSNFKIHRLIYSHCLFYLKVSSWEKTNSTTFALPYKNFGKIPLVPSTWKNPSDACSRAVNAAVYCSRTVNSAVCMPCMGQQKKYNCLAVHCRNYNLGRGYRYAYGS